MTRECENVTLYFYGELEQAQTDAFKAHLKQCPRCRQELELLAQTQEALIPPAAPQSVVERVLAPAQAKPIIGYLRRILRPALTAVLLIGVGVYMFVAGPKPEQWLDDGRELVAYISEEADAEYNQFVTDFEAFENEF